MITRAQRGPALAAVRLPGEVLAYPDLFPVRDDCPLVEVTLRDAADLLALRSWVAATPDARWLADAHTRSHVRVSLAVPPESLDSLAEVPGAVAIAPTMSRQGMLAAVRASQGVQARPARTAAAKGPAPNQAVDVLRVAGLRALYPALDGRGLRLAVVSDSCDKIDSNKDGIAGIRESQATGDLPTSDRLRILYEPAPLPGVRDEGRAMMELAWDVAPGLDEIIFASGYDRGEAGFAQAIRDCAAAGANVITDDLLFFTQPQFEDGVVAEAVQEFSHSGGLYVSLAQNFGDYARQDHWSDPDANQYHNFPDGSEYFPVHVAPGGVLIVGIQWAEPWGRATSDFDLELVDPSQGYRVLTSSNTANADPFDSFVWSNGSSTSIELALRVRSTADSASNRVFKFTIYDSGTSAVTMTAYPELAAGTIPPHGAVPQALCIGAAAAATPSVVQPYSGNGPAMRFFVAGEPTSTPTTFLKPDFISVDGCSTSFYGSDSNGDGFPDFFGTSAAAPNAAAVSALLLQAAGGPGTLDVNGLRAALRWSALDLGTAGWDRSSGYGRIHALGAAAYLFPGPSSGQTLYPNQFGDVEILQNMTAATGALPVRIAFSGAQGNDGFWRLARSSGDATLDPMFVVYTETGEPSLLPAHVCYGAPGAMSSSLSFPMAAGAVYTACLLSETPIAVAGSVKFSVDGPVPQVAPLTLTPAGDASIAADLTAQNPHRYYELFAPYDAGTVLDVSLNSPGFEGMLMLRDSNGVELARAHSPALPGSPIGSQVVLSWVGVQPTVRYVLQVSATTPEQVGTFSLSASFETVPGQPLTLSQIPQTVSGAMHPNPVAGTSTMRFNSLPVGQTAHWLYVPSALELSAALSVDDPEQPATVGVYTLNGVRLGFLKNPGKRSTELRLSPGEGYLVRFAALPDALGAVTNVSADVQISEHPAPVSNYPEPTEILLSTTEKTIPIELSPLGAPGFVIVDVPPVPALPKIALHVECPEGVDGAMLLYDVDGLLIASADNSGPGGSESLIGAPATSSARYYLDIRVSTRETSLAALSIDQLFRLTAALVDPPPTPTPTATPFVTYEPTASPTPSATPTISPTPSPTSSPTATPAGPAWSDTDGDGFSDLVEQTYGTSPEDSTSIPPLGDCNGDGRATMVDALDFYRQLRSGQSIGYTIKLDLNLDERLDAADAMILYRWLLKTPGYEIIPRLPQP